MAELSTQDKLYLEANSKSYDDERGNFQLLNDGLDDSVSYIGKWEVSGLAKPTTEQLNSYNSTATTYDNNVKVRRTRKQAYGDIGDQLDLLYKDIVAGKVDTTGEWAKKIKAVKDANAKS